MNFKTFFSAQNLFQVNNAFISPEEKLLLLAGAVAFLLAIILKIAAALAPSPVDKEFRVKLYRVFMFFGLGEIFWYLCRWQNVPFFGSHFISGLIFFISLIWLVWVLAMFVKNYSAKKEEWNKEQVKLKYLQK